MVGKIYRGVPTDAQVRKFAHQFADEIIFKLSGGLPGIASTQIAFISSRTGAKEVWVMDYDGANQHPLTSLPHHLLDAPLVPRQPPAKNRTSPAISHTYNGVVNAQICMYSVDAGKVIAFPRFRGTNSAPAWSPDGTQIMFSSSMLGNPELFVTDINGSKPKRLSFSNGGNTSPAWNPKTGQSVVFVSDRGGIPKLYMMNADGTIGEPPRSSGQRLSHRSGLVTKRNVIGLQLATPRRQLRYLRHGPHFAAAYRQSHSRTPELATSAPAGPPDGRQHRLRIHPHTNGPRQIWTMLADGSAASPADVRWPQRVAPNWSSK